mgnify:CR=1 FL=1
MITEHEAREAAKAMFDDQGQPTADGMVWFQSEAILAQWAIQELARREAERAERAKPIDAEWCLVNGACDCGSHMRFLVNELHLLWHKASEITRLNGTNLGAIKTCGQLLDLLAALK